MANDGIVNWGSMKLDDITGLVDIEYGVNMVGDCIMDQGELMVGVTLIVGITRTGAGAAAADAAAAAAALRLRLPPA